MNFLILLNYREISRWQTSTMWSTVATGTMYCGWIYVDRRICTCYEGWLSEMTVDYYVYIW